MWAEVIQ